MNLPLAAIDWSSDGAPVRSAPIDIPQPVSSGSPQSSRPARSRPSSDGWLLRRGLYSLKDELQRCIELLTKAIDELQPSQKALASDVTKSYQSISQAISVLLSNDGSDWIESGIAGGLTYAEFLELDADCIRDFTLQLERMVDDIDPERWQKQLESPWKYPCEPRPAPPGSIDSLVNEGLLDRLESLAQVLAATLGTSRT